MNMSLLLIFLGGGNTRTVLLIFLIRICSMHAVFFAFSLYIVQRVKQKNLAFTNGSSSLLPT